MSDPTPLEVWLQGFPRGEAEARLKALEAEAQTIRSALALADALSKPQNGSAARNESAGEPATRPAAIRQILRERGNEPMLPGAIKDEMLRRGWLREQDLKLFYAAVSTMTKRRHLLRLQQGGYMLSKAGMEMD